jgi:hypothetical protein
MNHKRVLAIASLAAVFATAAMTAQAAEVGFYIGATYGQTDKQVNKIDFDAYTFGPDVYAGLGFTPTSFASSVDDSFNGYGFYGGYRFNRHLAVEGGYLNLGSFKYRAKAMGLVSGQATNSVFNYDGQTSGINVSALGVWPLSYRWEVYGRAGVLFGTNTASQFYADGIQGPGRRELSENSVDMLAGIGTSFTVLEIYDLHLEYQRVFDAGDKAIGEGDADTISVGISVTF